MPPPQGKLPVSPDMLRWIWGGLDITTDFGVFLWGALMLAFFFLLRSSEYASSQGHFDTSRALLKGDVTFFRAGVPVTNYHLADEVVLCIRGSKTDQQHLGVLRNSYKTGEVLSPVVSAAAVMSRLDARGARDDEPFFSYAPGKTIDRTHVGSHLKKAAGALGQNEADFAPHSLRAGGASCMLACGYSEETIRRQGRWHSFCWRRYAYDAREQMQKIAQAMATSTYTVMLAGQDFLLRRRRA